MTKVQLIKEIAEKFRKPRRLIAPVVESVFEFITDALARGEKCTFVGFGVFDVKERAAREGRNPRIPTVVVKIPARKVAAFRPGKSMREKVLRAKSRTKKKKLSRR